MGRPADGRTHKLSIRLDDDERAQLERLARAQGQSIADFIRQLIRQLVRDQRQRPTE